MRRILKHYLKPILMQLGWYEICRDVYSEVYSEIAIFLRTLPQLPGSFVFWVYNYIIAFVPCHALRIFSLRHLLGITIGKGCFVHLGVMFVSRDIEIGDYCVIGRGVLFSGPVTLGNNISISAGTWFIAASHDKNSKIFAGTVARIFVEDYVWTGMRSVIMPGVRVRQGCVLGAHAVLTKSPPPWTVVAGVPAKVIGTRSDAVNYTLKYYPFFN